jgi:hypothetical protein
MRRTQHCVLLRLTSRRSRGPSLLLRHPVLPRNSSTRGVKIGEGRGGKIRQRITTVAQSLSLRFLNFSSYRMGRLRHNIMTHPYTYIQTYIYLFHWLIIDPEYGRSTFPRKIMKLLQDYVASYRTRKYVWELFYFILKLYNCTIVDGCHFIVENIQEVHCNDENIWSIIKRGK